MNDVLRFIGLAAALGLAAGMILGTMALVLAAPAHAERPADAAEHGECRPAPAHVPTAPHRLEV